MTDRDAGYREGIEAAELLPCPFCGGPATLGGMPKGIIGEVRCRNNDCFGPKTTALTKADNIRQWNTRAPLPSTPDYGKEAMGDKAMSVAANPSDIVGMSLRDYFAAHSPITWEVAAAVLEGRKTFIERIVIDADRAAIFAIWALLNYEYADVMIAQREEK